jgi:hypothetical protein
MIPLYYQFCFFKIIQEWVDPRLTWNPLGIKFDKLKLDYNSFLIIKKEYQNVSTLQISSDMYINYYKITKFKM